MKLIAISRDIFLNIDKIESIQRKEIMGSLEVTVKTDTDEYVLERDFISFIAELEQSEVELPISEDNMNKIQQFVHL